MSRTQYLVFALLLAAAITLLLYVAPRGYFRYFYTEGQPWNYSTLIADFQYDVKKSEHQLQAEQAAALKGVVPYYRLEPTVGEEAVAALRLATTRSGAPDVPAAYVRHAIAQLRQVYTDGILATSDMAGLNADSVRSVHVETGQQSVIVDLEHLFSEKTAYEHILLADTAQFSPAVLARLNLNQYLTPNLTLDATKTASACTAATDAISGSAGLVSKGERIVDRGEVVTSDVYARIRSYEQEVNLRGHRASRWMPVAGQAIFMLLAFGAFVLYLRLFRRDYFAVPRHLALCLTLIVLFTLATYVMRTFNIIHVFILPYAMVPMFVRILMDTRTAFMAHFTTLLLCSIALADPYPFLLVETVAGLTTVYALKDLSERSGVLRAVAYVVALSLLTLFSYQLWNVGEWTEFSIAEYEYLLLSGVLLLFAYPLLYLIERLFHFTSSVTLVELANTNNPILRRMSKEAQGTFVHSMQVSNLAADVADAIGAKPLLARVGALYHDIGKILTPAFFTENQNGVNPHDKLTQEESADIIIAHVKNGLRLASAAHLPAAVSSFIRTHHGRSQAKYFAIQWENAHPGEQLPADRFTYPGPNPTTREEAVVMMCDSVEAASRSLKEYNEESIRSLVERLVDAQVSAGYFAECPLTFRDISVAKRTLCESLKTIYHTRIAYPEKAGQSEADADEPIRLRGFRIRTAQR